jgi:hypothetical protein
MINFVKKFNRADPEPAELAGIIFAKACSTPLGTL